MKEITGYLLPGYKVYEYQLVIQPHEELRNKITGIKKDFFDKYQAGAVPWGKPRIILVHFFQYLKAEERILNRLRHISMGYQPVKIELKDFNSFPSHTIYINITSRIPVQNLVKQIRSEARYMMKINDDNKPHFILEPHLTIAQKLKPWQYEKGWLEYSHRHFTGRFIADAMLLLKRPVGELKYEIAQRFEFQNLPVATKQGELFG
jgi:2'-5' RNA ligase